MARRSPQHNRDTLNAIIDAAEDLKDELSWLYSVAYSRLPDAKEDAGRRSVGVHSDLTFSQASTNHFQRMRYRQAVGKVQEAKRLMLKASAQVQDAMEAADQNIDEQMVSPGPDRRGRDRPTISRAELRQAQTMQAQRKRAGKSWGEG